jgi:hypothetical protein
MPRQHLSELRANSAPHRKDTDMGVTIHFEGTLRDQAAYEEVVRTARTLAEQEGWKWQVINESGTTLRRLRNEQEADYTGPTRGIALYPHENSETLQLEFDRDLFVQDYIKTQFAPIEVHLKVVGLLKEIAPQFSQLVVDDEGEYWDTDSVDVLAAHMQACVRAIEEQLASRPNLEGPVRLSSGRIADLISRT